MSLLRSFAVLCAVEICLSHVRCSAPTQRTIDDFIELLKKNLAKVGAKDKLPDFIQQVDKEWLQISGFEYELEATKVQKFDTGFLLTIGTKITSANYAVNAFMGRTTHKGDFKSTASARLIVDYTFDAAGKIEAWSYGAIYTDMKTSFARPAPIPTDDYIGAAQLFLYQSSGSYDIILNGAVYDASRQFNESN